MNAKTMMMAGALLAAAGLASAAEQKAGSSINKAIQLKTSQTVTLVNEYDPDWKANTDTGVAWYKFAQTKGVPATVWITGGDTRDLWDFSVDVNWDDYDGDDVMLPDVFFDPYVERDDGAIKICYLNADSWGEEDPSTVVFYICISGEIGQTCTLHYAPRIETFTKVGEEGNPKRITATDTSQKDAQTLLASDTGGDYYYIVHLEEGRKYSIRTTGGTAAQPLEIIWDGDYEQPDKDPAYTNDTKNASYLVFPEASADYIFHVSGVEGQAFNLKYWSYPKRAPAKHKFTELTARNGYAATGVPGRVTNNDNTDRTYFDDVIDDFLVRIKLSKGDRRVFETSGSTGNIQMRIYDSDGKRLATNDTLGRGSLDVRAAVEATYDGYYYVGVCNPALADWDATPTSPKVKITARSAEEFLENGECDQYDLAGDAAWGKASLLDPIPATAGSLAANIGKGHGSHVLSGGDWYDWYAVPCRSNLTYVLKAEFDGDDWATWTDLRLFAKVYRVVDGVLTRYNTGVRGTVTPAEADQGTMQFLFKADRDGMFYVRVSVEEGVGLDYPAHTMHAIVYGDDDLGVVQVNTKGLDGTWYFTDSPSATYPGGARVAIPVGKRNVRFSADASYTTPGKTSVTAKSWNTTSNATVVTGWYVDIADPADNSKSGAVFLAPSAKERKVKRTLWADKAHADAADWYKFTATAGVYYNFWVEDTTPGEDGGDVVFSVQNSSGRALKSAQTELRRWTSSAGTYYIKAEHAAGSSVDSTYRFWYSSANVGVISFPSASVNVSEAASYVDVTVNRSSTEGMVRVNFATEALTAKPGSEYYPTNGVLEWAAGDNSPKTVRVRLIPDLVDAYDEQKKFKVVLWPIAEDGLADDEYPATISGSTFCTVKIKECTAQNPGTIVAVAPDPLEVTAGETLRVTFRRVGGSDGKIAVKVKTQSSTATMGTNGSADFDYNKQVFEWKAGDSGDRYFEVKTTALKKPAEDLMMRLKLSTLATGAYAGNLTPALAASKIYVPIRNPVNAGTIVAVAPDPRLVVAGETMKVVLRRTGGSNGKIAVKVKTQSSTAIMGTNGSADFDYNKQILEWKNGETADKTFEVKTMPCKKFEANKQLRLKLSTLATGTYAGNFRPALAESKIYYTIWNQLLPKAASGGPVAKISSGKDAYGRKISEGEVVNLVKGVVAYFYLGAQSGTATECKVVQGSLPPGMSVGTGSYTLRVYGAPTAVGNYKALLQVFNGSAGGTTVELDFHVSDSGLAFGSFTGVPAEVGDASLADKMPRIGSLSFAADSVSGKLSAKVNVGGTTYSFSANGYASVETNDVPEGAAQVMNVTMKDKNANQLALSVLDGPSTNLAALGMCAGTAALTLNIQDEEVFYACELVRDNKAVDGWLDAASAFDGYYTLALVPEGVSLMDGVPAGNGYLTMTVADGVAKCAGLLADGTEVSSSSPVALRGDVSDPAGCILAVPVFQIKSPYSFGGLLMLRPDGAFDSRTALGWNKDGEASSYDRQGFSLAILPTGGWYDTVVNLQTYYLDRDLTVEAEPITGLPAGMLPSGTYTVDSSPHGVAADLDRNTLTVPARKLVKDATYENLVDFAASVNPWKVKMAFNRATGLVSGTFQAFSITSTKSTSLGTFNHYGVLLMNRDAASPLDVDVWTAGFGLMPLSTGWTMSIPFNIRAVTVDRDWSELPAPAK